MSSDMGCTSHDMVREGCGGSAVVASHCSGLGKAAASSFSCTDVSGRAGVRVEVPVSLSWPGDPAVRDGSGEATGEAGQWASGRKLSISSSLSRNTSLLATQMLWPTGAWIPAPWLNQAVSDAEADRVGLAETKPLAWDPGGAGAVKATSAEPGTEFGSCRSLRRDVDARWCWSRIRSSGRRRMPVS